MAIVTDMNIQCPKLTSENFYEWRFKFKALCMKHLCLDALEGYVDTEDEDGTQRKGNMKCLGLLICHVSDSYHDLIEDCKTAKDAYEKLEAHCTQYNALNIIDFLCELCNCEKTEEMSMQDYISKVNTCHKKLKESKLISLGDQALAGIYLKGLRKLKKYESFIRSLDLSAKEFTPEKIISKLLLEDLRDRSNKVNEEESEAIALKAQVNFKKKFPEKKNYKQGQNNNNSEKKYYHKGNKSESNHSEEGKSENFVPRSDRTVICYCCGGKGHIARFCPKMNPEDEKKSNDSKKGEAKVVTREYKALTAQTSNISENEGIWLLDGGASDHMTARRDLMRDYVPMEGEVIVGDGRPLKIKGKGRVMLHISEECGGFDLDFQEVLHVPDLKDNLISQGLLERKGLKIVSFGGKTEVFDGDRVFLTCHRVGTLYFMTTTSSDSIEHLKKIYSDGKKKLNLISADTWHNRLGHVHNEALMKIPPISKDIKITRNEEKCEVCIRGKMKCTVHPKEGESGVQDLLERIHSDVSGPISPVSLGKCKYFVTFLDHFSNFITTFAMKKKNEVFQMFVKYQRRVELQLKKKIVELQSDNGIEYTVGVFGQHLEECGILHRRTVPGNPQQNGKAERINQTLMNAVRCLLIRSGLPRTFWAEALQTAAYLRNLCPSAAINGKIPFEVWYDRELTIKDLKKLRIFGCQAWIAKGGQGKLGERAEECVFLGYPVGVKGYRLYSLSRQKVIVSRDVYFNEKKFPFLKQETPNEVNHSQQEEILFEEEEDDEDETNRAGEEEEEPKEEELEEEGNSNSDISTESESEEGNEEFQSVGSVDEAEGQQPPHEAGPQPEVRRSAREKKAKPPCSLPCCSGRANVAKAKIIIPKNVKEALASPQSQEWLKAMEEEIGTMREKKTWEIVRRTQNMNVVGCKWVFALKKDYEGRIIKFKARLVAQGFSQIAGLDFHETYSPVMRRRCLRILIAVAVENQWGIHQVDVVAAYLNSPIDTTVYMRQPSYFEEGDGYSYVCELKKSVYGLKQSGRNWNHFLHECLMKIGMQQCETDPCVYHKKDLIVGIHVDDMLVVGEAANIDQFKMEISSKLKIKDLGHATLILSTRVTRERHGEVKIDQSQFIHQLVEDFEMTDSFGHPTPLLPGSEKRNEQGEEIDSTMYRKAVCSMLYASGGTRPDIAYAVSRQSQHCEDPVEDDWKAVIRMMGYLKKTEHYGIHYSPTGRQIEVFVDADWASDQDGVSVGGYVIKMANGAISWRSKKQKVPADKKKRFSEDEEEEKPLIATSTTHSEYYALYEVVIEVEWLMSFLKEIGQEKFVQCPVKIFVDNTSTIKLANNENFSERTKNIRVKFHYTRQLVKEKVIELVYVRSSENQANIFTKALPGPKTKELSQLIGLF